MASPNDAANEQFASHGELLRLLVRIKLGPQYRGQIRPSDVVQEALLKAIERREQFRGTTPEEYEAWLRQILASKLAEPAGVSVGSRRRYRLNTFLKSF